MALNANKVKSKGGDRVEQPELEAGGYPSRVVQVIDLGLQPQRAFQGAEKPPANMLHLTYELSDEFIVDKDGDLVEDKPRWLSEDFALHHPDSDLATSTKRFKSLDPSNELDFDWSKTLGLPVTLNVVVNPGKGKNKGKVYNNIASTSAMRTKEMDKLPELVNPSVMFDLDEPDLEVFNSLPEWLQTKIKENLEYEGSKLYKALSGKPVEKSEPEDSKDESEDEDGNW